MTSLSYIARGKIAIRRKNRPFAASIALQFTPHVERSSRINLTGDYHWRASDMRHMQSCVITLPFPSTSTPSLSYVSACSRNARVITRYHCQSRASSSQWFEFYLDIQARRSHRDNHRRDVIRECTIAGARARIRLLSA